MPRRRSARLASGPKTPKAAAPPQNLASLVEREESAGEDALQSMNAVLSSPPPQTPASSSAVKPPMSEMHPSKVHLTMAAPSSGLRLGFTDIDPADCPSRDQPSGVTQSTPSKTPLPSSPFTFSFKRPQADLGLSNDAQRMMNDLREEALKIKADLIAKHEEEALEEQNVQGRKFARPKGKAGRYSSVHMAEFKKMDSIANHPSAFRAQPGRSTPMNKGVKRTQSKANLDDSEPIRAKEKSAEQASPFKNSSLVVSDTRKSTMKRNLLFSDAPPSAAKRARQHMDDDASSGRPVSRDGSFLPRPTTAGKDVGGIPRSQTLASLMTPTKASLARLATAKSPAASLVKTPSRLEAGFLKKSVTASSLAITEAKEEVTTSVTGPSRFDKVKSILRGYKSEASKAKSTLPLPSGSILKPSAPATAERALKPLPAPSTTPRRKLSKRVAFTPDTTRAAILQNSPSPFKSAIPQSKSRNNPGEVQYPTLDTIMTGKSSEDDVAYPDLSLSAFRPLPEAPAEKDKVPPAKPGTFTFRSDHTIRFGSASPTGFGSSPGQASLRHVRPSIMPMPVDMPGSFPGDMDISSPNKENKRPPPILAAAHGLSNKKRHRVSEADEEAEEQERAAKKRKNEPVPEGDALLAPKLMARKPGFSSPKKPSQIARYGGGSRTPSPAKKKAGLSLSRLNMLARPKLRK